MAKQDFIDIYKSNKDKEGYNLTDPNHMSSLFRDIQERVPDDTLRMSRANPTFKVLFIEEDSEAWGYLDDLYGWNSVNSIQIFKSRKSASDTAVITLTNIRGRLDDKRFKDKSHSRSSEENFGALGAEYGDGKFEKTLLSPGTKIRILMGYSSDINELENVFTGKIATVEHGDIVTFVAQSYGMELLLPKGFDYNEKIVRNWRADPVNLLSDLIMSREIQNFGRWGPGGATTGEVLGQERSSPLLPLYNRPQDDNIYLDRSLHRRAPRPWGGKPHAFSSSRWSWSREFKLYRSTTWDIFQEMATRFPGYIATVEPYDNRATMFFGLPDQPYWFKGERGIKNEEKAWEASKKKIQFSHVRNTDDLNRVSKFIKDREEAKVTQEDIKDSKMVFDLDDRDIGVWEKINSIQSQNLEVILSEEEKEDLKKSYARKMKRYLTRDDASHELIRDIGQTDSGNSYKLFRDLALRDPEKVGEYFEVIPKDGKVTLRLKGNNSDGLKKDKNGNIMLDKDGIESSAPPLHPRKKVFRNYHYKDSYHHIISNGIKINLDNFYNRIVVQFQERVTERKYEKKAEEIQKLKVDNNKTVKKLNKKIATLSRGSGKKKEVEALETTRDKAIASTEVKVLKLEAQIQKPIKTQNFTMVADDSIDEEYYRTKVVYERNAASWWDACNYSLGHLWRSLKELYDGELLILGDARIKPYDRVFIYDMYTDMHGPIEVREVIHEFSKDTGFVTTIVPDLVVHVNDPTSIVMIILAHNTTLTLAAAGVFVVGATTVLGGLLAITALALLSKAGTLLFGKLGYNLKRREPVSITPLSHNGRPFIAGFEGMKRENIIVWVKDRFVKWGSDALKGIASLFGGGLKS